MRGIKCIFNAPKINVAYILHMCIHQLYILLVTIINIIPSALKTFVYCYA